MPGRDHIIYTHPARANGFAYFYIGYRPGKSKLFLRFRRRGEDEGETLRMSVARMLRFLEKRETDPESAWPSEVIEPALTTLRLQVRRWKRDNGMAAC